MSNSPYEKGEQLISAAYAEKDALIAERVAAKQAAAEDFPPETIVRNSMITPDGTELNSRGRHDYVSHTDENGDVYITDGGRSYLRRSINDKPATDTSVYLYHGHERVREAYDWGTYGINGDQPLEYKLLKDMNDGHIQALIDQIYPNTPLMLAEQQWRESAVARKMVRKKDIERLMILKDKYSAKPEIVADLDVFLEEIVEKFNSNEFGDTTV